MVSVISGVLSFLLSTCISNSLMKDQSPNSCVFVSTVIGYGTSYTQNVWVELCFQENMSKNNFGVLVTHATPEKLIDTLVFKYNFMTCISVTYFLPFGYNFYMHTLFHLNGSNFVEYPRNSIGVLVTFATVTFVALSYFKCTRILWSYLVAIKTGAFFNIHWLIFTYTCLVPLIFAFIQIPYFLLNFFSFYILHLKFINFAEFYSFLCNIYICKFSAKYLHRIIAYKYKGENFFSEDICVLSKVYIFT